MLSTVMIIVGMGYSSTVPAEKMLAIDFTGGANLRMVCVDQQSADRIRNTLAADAKFAAEYPTTGVNTYGESGNEYNVRLKLNSK
ncbi:MAG TPA: hypothetical protein EYP98_17160, partial [Planctomycetes bacterium]|nr:hypothetical protein [Planctomycetota bacterium]